MKVETILAKDLPGVLLAEWREIQLANPALAGPCFHPTLFRTVGEYIPDVALAVLDDGSQRGFLPYQRDSSSRRALPVPMCDYQAIISRPGRSWDVAAILRASGLLIWDVTALISASRLPTPDHLRATTNIPLVVVSEGAESYVSALRADGKTQRNLAAKRRRLERDAGPIRFVPNVEEASMFETLYRWKDDRFGNFASWARSVIEQLRAADSNGLSSQLSVLYSGGTAVAVHFGLRADGILYYWFPAFNPEMRRYSPGALLLQELIAHLPAFEAHTIDLGPGREAYKDYFSNSSVVVLEGAYELPSTLAHMRQLKRLVRRAVESHPLVSVPARAVLRAARSFRVRSTSP